MSNVHIRRYGKAALVPFVLYDLDGIKMNTGPSFVIGDIKISKDDGAIASAANFPVNSGFPAHSLNLTAAEMTAKSITVMIRDQSVTQLWLDTAVHIVTEGHPSAGLHLKGGLLNAGNISSVVVANTQFSLSNGSTDNAAYVGAVIIIDQSTTLPSHQRLVGKITTYDAAQTTVTIEDTFGAAIIPAGALFEIYATDMLHLNYTPARGALIDNLTGHIAQTADHTANVSAILADTGEIGVAGAGLTNINLPDQAMNITGNLTGSVGSVTGHTPQTGDSFARLGAPAGASVSADVATRSSHGAADVDTTLTASHGAGAWTTGAGGGDSLLLQSTTLATVASQISFTLTAGSTDNDAYVGSICVITDSVTPTQKTVGRILTYSGTTKTVTLVEAPGAFTIAAGDTIDIIAWDKQFLDYTSLRGQRIDDIFTDTNIMQPQVAAIQADTADMQPKLGIPSTTVSGDIATRSSHTAADVWTSVTRTITDKTGFSLSTAGILAIWHQLTSAVVNVSTMGKRIIDNLNATITSRQPSGPVDLNANQAGVTIGTVTTNTDMRGTDNAALASVATETRLSELDAVTAGKMANQVDAIRTDTGEIGVAGAGLTNINLPDQTMNITGNLTGSVGSVTGHTPQTADHTAAIAAVQADTNDIQTRIPTGLLNGFMLSDVISIAGDPVPAAGLRDTYNGIGYDLPTAPATQQQISNIANVGAAINKEAAAFTPIVGVVSSGTFVTTHAVDGIAHIITDSAGAIDVFYTFDIGAQGVPTTATAVAIINGNNDSVNVLGWDWVSSSWVQIGVIAGKTNTTSFDTLIYNMFTGMVGTGINAGEVRVAFQGTGLTAATLRIDQIFVSFSNNKSVTGYESGKVWVNTISGTAGTVADVNGVADLPVNAWSSAQTIANAKSLSRFDISNGSQITLTASVANKDLFGEEWDLDLAGQDISEATFHGATVTGIGIGALTPEFEHCKINGMTINGGMLRECGLVSTLTIGAAGSLTLHECHSMIAGLGAPILDFGATVGNSSVSFRDYSGGIDIRNMGQIGSDSLTLEGNGQLIIGADVNPANCTIVVRGNFSITDNVVGGFVAGGGILNTSANFTIDSVLPVTTGDITAATSGTSFTISNVVDSDGNPVTLATDMFAGQILKATTRSGGTASNVIDQEVMIASMTAGGVVTVKVDDITGAGFSATPNVTTTSFKLL